MTKRLTKHGNSYALVIERPVMKLLRITPETPLEMTTDGEVLVLSPVRSEKRKARFAKALSRTGRRFGRALKKPAK